MKVQTLRIALVLITIGCIVGPIGTVAIMYRNNLSQMIITPQLKQLLTNNNNSNGNGNNNNGNNNNNSNNNGNNNNNNSNNNGNSNSNNSNNNNGNSDSNSGNVNNNNQQLNNPTSSFGSTGQFDVTVQSSGSQVSDQMTANINCQVEQNGNNIQISLDLYPQNVPSDLQSIFNPSNDYVFNFDGTTTSSSSGTQITANAQGNLNPGGTFNINLNGAIDQNQDTFTFTLTSAANSQASITTPQEINAQSNNNNNGNNNNNSNNNSNNGSNGNNNNSNGINVNFDSANSQIDTASGKITLTFTLNNTNNQDATLSKMSGTVVNNQDQVTLGTVSLQSSVTINAGQSSQVVVSGSLSSQGKNDLLNNFAGATSIDIEIAGGTMTVNGASQSNSQTQDLGNINIVN